MIEWPAEEDLEGAAKSNVDRFKKTAAARELEEDGATWRFHSWSRTPEAPVRMILVNENGDEAVWTFDNGSWTMRKKDRVA